MISLKLKIAIGIILAILIIGAALVSYFLNQTSGYEPDPSIQTAEDLNTFIAATFADNNIPGAAVSIIANGDVAWSNGYGFANLETQRPATADTPFMLGSISKVVTGVSLMQAVEAGHLDLDSDINETLPFIVNNPHLDNEIITLRHLATHTSGIADNDTVYDGSYASGDPKTPLGTFVSGYLQPNGEWYSAKKNFETTRPGETYLYSNIAAGLAGYMLEASSGTPLNEWSENRLFTPLNMENTGWFLADFPDQEIIAIPYSGKTPYEHYGYPTWPDGQLRSSANDMGRFLAMVINDGEWHGEQLLQPETLQEMFRPQFPGTYEEGKEVGLFWHYQNGLIGHTGGDDGVLTFMFFDPKTEIGAVILMNADAYSPTAQIAAVQTIRQILRSEQTPQMFTK